VGRSAVGLGRRIGGRPAEAVTAHVQQRTAEQLFATLGELEGGAMKVGQAMSAMEAALPDQLVGPYREALVRLQEAAPAMPTSMATSSSTVRSPAAGGDSSASSTTGRSPRRAWVRCTARRGRTARRSP
jgi:hypothetical protein